MVDAYILVFAGLLLPAGAVGDRYGRKKVMMIGLALFGLASLAAAMTTSPAQLIAIRAVMGIGAAILTPITLAILPVIFPPEERTKAIAFATIGMGLGVPLGPLVGGYLLEHYWWGSIFLVNVPVVVLGLIAVGALVPESRDPDARPVDVPGALLSTVGLVALVYGIIEAPGRGWRDPLVGTAVAGGVLVLAVFVAWQRRARYPMIELDLFRRPRFLWGSVAATLSGFALFGLLFVLPQYLQVVRGNNTFGTGLRLLPLMGGLIVAARIAEPVVRAVGNKVPVVLGMLVYAAGLGLGASTGIHSGYAMVAGWLVVIGFGGGLSMTPAMDAVLGALTQRQSGAGSALTMTLRQVGGALGVAILGSVLAGAYADRIPAGAPAGARDSVAAAATIAAKLGDPELLRAGTLSYLRAMDLVLVVCAVVAVLGAALAGAFLPARAPGGPTEEQSEHELTRLA